MFLGLLPKKIDVLDDMRLEDELWDFLRLITTILDPRLYSIFDLYCKRVIRCGKLRGTPLITSASHLLGNSSLSVSGSAFWRMATMQIGSKDMRRDVGRWGISC